MAQIKLMSGLLFGWGKASHLGYRQGLRFRVLRFGVLGLFLGAWDVQGSGFLFSILRWRSSVNLPGENEILGPVPFTTDFGT